MSFWGTIGNIAKSVYTGVKEATKVFVETVVSGVKNALSGFNDSSKIKYGSGNGWTPPKPTKDEEERKARLREHMGIMTKYQEKIKDDSDKKETAVQKAYDAACKDILSTLRQFGIDVSDIKRFMATERSLFAHSMRDEVNTKVSPEYWEWKALMDDVNSDSEKIQAYTDNVYRNAKSNLLDKLKEAFKETNKQITRCVDKFLNDKYQALQIKKESLVNMTKDKDSKIDRKSTV